LPDSFLPGMNVAPLYGGSGGALGNNPMEMLNQLSEMQLRQNQNKAFQLKLQANQAIGEAIASAPSLDEGVNAAAKIPGALAWGGEALANIKQFQNLTAMYQGEIAKQSQSGFETLMKMGVPAGLADWQQFQPVTQQGLQMISPLARDAASKQLQAITNAATLGFDKMDMNDPTQRAQAQELFKTRITGMAAMGGVTPETIQQFYPKASMLDLGNQSVPVQTSPSIARIGPNGEIQSPNVVTPTGPGFGKGLSPQLGGLGQLPVGGIYGGGASGAGQAQTGATGAPVPYTYKTGLGADGKPVLAGDGKPLVSSAQSAQFQSSPGAGVGGLTPLEAEANKNAQDEFIKDGQKTLEAARSTQLYAHQLANGYDYLAKGNLEGKPTDQMMMTGPWAAQRENLAKIANFAAGFTGGELPFDPSKIATLEDMQKAHQALKFSFLQQNLGQQREAAQTIMNAGTAVPGIENTVLGGRVLSDLQNATAQYGIDRYNFMNEYQQNNGGIIQPAAGAFAAQHKPQDYIGQVFQKYGMTADGDWTSPLAVKAARDKGYLTTPEAQHILRMHPEWKPGGAQPQGAQ
jgi:hypothetical protein